jgi:hypothetical protein
MPRTDVLGRILAQADHELRPIVERARHDRGNFTLGQMEAGLQAALRNLGAFALGELCGLDQERHKRRVEGHRDVGQGTHWLPFKDDKEKGLYSVFGRIRFSRPYYHSADPQDSRWPRDEELGLVPGQIWSPGLQDVADYLATVTGSYQEAEKTLKKMLGVEVNYKQIQRDCLEVGAELAAEQKQAVEKSLEVRPSPESPPQKEGPAPECVMILADGTIVDEHSTSSRGSGLEVKVGRVDVACLQESKPAPKATQENGVAPTPADDERQKELVKLKESREQRQYKAATKLVKQALATAAPDRHEQPIYRPSNPTSRYCATAEKGIEMIGGLLWALAAAAGVERAAVVLFLADGSHWCWNLCDTHFPRAVKILDLFHLAGNILKAAGVLFGENSKQARDWACEKLVEILRGSLNQVLAELATLSYTDERKRKASRALQTYLTNNRERMDYPRYLAAGYPISSAAMEGACGHVIGDRMTGSGRGWDEIGADAMARLRALHCSEQWDTFYRERQKKVIENLRALKRAA